MNIIDFLKKYKWILLFGFIALLGVITIVLYNLQPSSPQKNLPVEDLYPTPFLSSSKDLPKASSIQKTIIGKTTTQEVEQLPERIGKTENPDGSFSYSFASPLNARPKQVLTKDDKVIFESIMIPENPTAEGYSKIDDYTSHYGQPEAILKGSKFYGWHMEEYVYSSQGFTLIANPFTKEVFEIHAYQPMDVDSYVKYYGEDITSQNQPPQE